MGNSPKGEYMLKRKNIVKLLGMGSLCLFLLGCSEESFLVQKESSTVILDEDIILSQKEDEELNILQKDNKGQSSAAGKDVGQKADTEESEGLTEDIQRENGAESQSMEGDIAVHICGAVNQPGVYYLKNGQRLYEGIQKAGSFREDADRDYLNQAMVLEDGMKITVPTREETEQRKKSEEISMEIGDNFVNKSKGYSQTEAGSDIKDQNFIQGGNDSDKGGTKKLSGKVDLNTADEALLCTLPGIGESRAKSIIAYREEHGPFQKPEDVMNVSGIKKAAFEKMKDHVMVFSTANIN